jgi:hypothetical protein
MAKKQSNTSENSAASQSAKPGMFIPIPTAEITNAAETARVRAEKEAEEARIRAEKAADEARKKAEKEAKEKADKKAADAVVALIRAIGVVEYTDACLEKINAANQAYAKLTADQKKLVENADVITTSEKEYDKLKKAAEVARKKAEREAKEVRKKAEYDAKKAKHEEISVKLKEYCVENDNSISTTWGTFRISNIKPADLWEFLQSKKDGQFKILTKEIEYTVKANASDVVDIKKHHFNISSKETKSASSTETLPQKVKRADYDTYRALLNDGKQPETGIIGRVEKIFAIVLVVLWAFFLIVNAIYTWVANSWFSCIIWVIITIAVFFGIMSLMQKIDEGHPVDTKSPDAGSFAHLAWRICWVLGLSIICEIIMMVIFVF